MRRKLALGLGLTGLLAGSAAGQFGSPPASPSPAPFGGATPARTPSVPVGPVAPMMPPGYVPPVGGFQPATPITPNNTFRPAAGTGTASLTSVEIPLALGPNHPLAVKPEDGAYFICVKSYSRPHKPDQSDRGYTVKDLAEGLARDIQQVHRSNAFLYEMVSEEKKAHAEAQTKAKQRAAEFAAAIEAYKQKSALQGMDFLGFDDRVKYQTFHYRDQVAVLVGGYKTEDEAVKALTVVKRWPAPRDEILMDVGSISTRRADGKSEIERRFINPYASAMVVQNPAIAKQVSNQPVPLDPFIVKLNEGRPYNLLKATKSWTISVKSFAAPVHFISKDEDTSLMKKTFGRSSDADVLRASGDQAESLAKALREMKDRYGNPMNLEAFVLHCRASSLVTVGQFDSPNDPELLDKQRILSNLTFNVSKDDRGMQITGAGQRLFGDAIQAVPIPRH
jgi:hypothetical protein